MSPTNAKSYLGMLIPNSPLEKIERKNISNKGNIS
jgi:hypothetical protein